jgi:hypothetical protein
MGKLKNKTQKGLQRKVAIAKKKNSQRKQFKNENLKSWNLED